MCISKYKCVFQNPHLDFGMYLHLHGLNRNTHVGFEIHIWILETHICFLHELTRKQIQYNKLKLNELYDSHCQMHLNTNKCRKCIDANMTDMTEFNENL